MADPTPNPEVLNALVRLMSSATDLSGVTDQQLVEAALEARQARRVAEGAAAAELSRRGWTWERIGEAMGVDPSTTHRWAAPYREKPE